MITCSEYRTYILKKILLVCTYPQRGNSVNNVQKYWTWRGLYLNRLKII